MSLQQVWKMLDLDILIGLEEINVHSKTDKQIA